MEYGGVTPQIAECVLVVCVEYAWKWNKATAISEVLFRHYVSSV